MAGTSPAMTENKNGRAFDLAVQVPTAIEAQLVLARLLYRRRLANRALVLTRRLALERYPPRVDLVRS